MNNVSLVGRLTRDVELRYTPKKAKAVGTFILAVDRDVKKGGESRITDFIPIVIWGKLAEFAAKYFAKGHRIALQGSINTRVWEDNDKNKHYVTEVIATKVYFADAKYKEIDVEDSSGHNIDENDLLDEHLEEEKIEAMSELNV